MGRQNATSSNEQLVGVNGGDVERRIAAGREHLSSPKETYRNELATETGLIYRRLSDADSLAGTLETATLATPRAQPTNVRWLPAMLALGLLVMISFARQP